ncbi:MAG: hypothetical protein LAN84_04420 [Acidobacteriia bacterium]|nr:hypothetical protein [Terriglobia bacterium]
MPCAYCHNMHGGTVVTRGEAAIEALCLSCHNGTYTDPQTGKTAVKVATHFNSRTNYGTWKISCLGCHSPHRYAKAEGTETLNPPNGYGNWMLVGDWVQEASSTDGLARIRRPVIVDTNGDNGGTGRTKFTDDVMTGYYCSSGIANDPACVKTDPPSASDQVRKVVFYDNRTPATAAQNQWAQPLIADPTTPGSRWYNGACNVCHTRTNHHRRDNSAPVDHDHNVTRACHDCHLHSNGWIK